MRVTPSSDKISSPGVCACACVRSSSRVQVAGCGASEERGAERHALSPVNNLVVPVFLFLVWRVKVIKTRRLKVEW